MLTINKKETKLTGIDLALVSLLQTLKKSNKLVM